MSRQEQFDFLFKIVMIGDSGVGKTNLLSRFVDNTFNIDSKPTIGVQFATKSVVVDNRSIKNQVWDTAGQERFRAITNAYYRGAVGAIVAFDLTKSRTFENVQKWLTELKENAHPNIVIMLLGNKSDLEAREVKPQAIENFINTNKLLYLETSAASGNNVELAFNELIKEIYNRMKAEMAETPRIASEQNSQKPTATVTKRVAEPTPAADSKSGNVIIKNSVKQQKLKKKGCC